MAVVAGVLSEARRRTLEAVCDTVAPAVEADTDDAVVSEFFARSASDLGIAAQIEGLLAQSLMAEEIEGLGQLLDAIGDNDFAEQPLEVRTQILHGAASSGPEAKLGVRQLRALTLLFFYALPDASGRNPNWDAIGYPGPLSAPPPPDEAPKTINTEHVTGATVTLEADVCVIGSGAGGAVIAAELQRSGRQTVVLEQGQYRNESDFKQLELAGMLELYLGGGLAASEDGSIAIFAGSTLGGGTVVNYMNCIRTPERIRREWASMGVDGLDTPDYNRHLDAIWERLSVNDGATSQNRTHKKLIAGCEGLGYGHRPLTRNADPSCDDPRVCGYCFSGCQKGCKQSTLKTFLQDASDAGARVVAGARAERVLVQDGHATGVQATVTQADGSTTALTINARTVVVACGAIESPALLLRSGIGGPAVGKHLRLHPAGVVSGVYEEPIEGWIGQIQSELSDQFADCEGEHGFLLEAVGVAPGLQAMSLPWMDGQSHKERMARTLKHSAPFVSVARDHGEGQVVIDDYGRAVTRWGFDDEVDARMFRKAMVEQAKLHHAAGATEIVTFYQQPVIWHEGEDFNEFLAEIDHASLAANDIAMFTAHQMGSCRLGADPATSVADGRGQLHDTAGVWIGDGSAFPTAPGVNPMISIMALAHRTAENIKAG
ncbi:MAG: FAD-dependent oxidoreductase [Solirubrobacterales bacterium]|nr:FAD-dependent oxidoreductase [Solirubrobacterales bacterium]